MSPSINANKDVENAKQSRFVQYWKILHCQKAHKRTRFHTQRTNRKRHISNQLLSPRTKLRQCAVATLLRQCAKAKTCCFGILSTSTFEQKHKFRTYNCSRNAPQYNVDALWSHWDSHLHFFKTLIQLVKRRNRRRHTFEPTVVSTN